ncbi:hypothetical protein DLJ53_34250 [Acuticoccus sediminis]|uniref:Antitoxin-like ribbon-helix-helix domain-containing protein n=1 Tax=Acuticoccus sediminis TaxID=2184697 RepID=A0A8B2NC34_9HYPH|nr:hypothetical protein DLJ53_34250 [Acuticoccus sediminis]
MQPFPSAAPAARETPLATSVEAISEAPPTRPAIQPSRQGTKAITGHYPPAVRYQLKLLAAEKGRTMEDMLAEGLNMLFAAHGKPEIAPASRKPPER